MPLDIRLMTMVLSHPCSHCGAKTHEEGQLVCFQGNLLMSRLPSFSADDIRGKGHPLCQAHPFSFACSN
jgi:hypothetical protein